MDWNKGFSAAYFARFVDPLTFRSLDRFEVTGGKISEVETDLRESADIDCVNYTAGERWIRIFLNARQGESSVTPALFTGLSSCPDTDINGRVKTNTIKLYSVLKPADDVLLERGWYAPQGVEGAEMIKTLLSVTPAPVVIEGQSPRLTDAIIAEEDETRLTMVDKILTAIGWRLRIKGDGTIILSPTSSEPVTAFGATISDVIETQLKIEVDWYECPNVFRAISGDQMAIAKDEDEDSPLSIPSRGREIWMQDTSCNLNDGESIGEYAMRRLKEEQKYAVIASYDRRFHPDVRVSDVVRMNYPAQGLIGDYMVTSQSIVLGHGAKTSEEVVKI